MNILILGSGGREHTLAWKIAQSSSCNKLFIAPGNAGTLEIGQNMNIEVTDFEEIKKLVLKENIDMVVVGPEDPLVNGIFDFFQEDNEISHVSVIGPSMRGAQLEGSKSFAKEFMQKNNIPTAKYRSFTKDNIKEGESFLNELKAPYVLKADGLAAGKGVLIINDLEEAKKELKSMLLDNKFGAASSTVVIEEYLDGIELSVFILTNGDSYKILPTAKDYKRIGEGDTGLNTGGMGAISPVPFVDRFLMEKIEQEIIKPTIEGLKNENIVYQGFLFIGLIKVGSEPKVIEYNVRMGDPECQTILPKLKTDLLDIFLSCCDGKLDQLKIDWNKKKSMCVVLCSKGYPDKYKKNVLIENISKIQKTTNDFCFHAGTNIIENKIFAIGGRVLNFVSLSENFSEARKKIISKLKELNWTQGFYRKDIGHKVIDQ